MPSIVGHTLSTPETSTLPVRGASRQVSGTVTGTVLRAVTLKLAEPPQLSAPSMVFALKLIEKPLPAGSPPMVALSLVAADKSIVPVFVKPFGPTIV